MRFSGTELGRQRAELMDGGEITEDAIRDLLVAASEDDLADFRALNLVGVAETLEHLTGFEVDGEAVPVNDAIRRDMLRDEVRAAAVEALKNKLFRDDGSPEVS